MSADDWLLAAVRCSSLGDEIWSQTGYDDDSQELQTIGGFDKNCWQRKQGQSPANLLSGYSLPMVMTGADQR
jgi:hypothetical protein